MTTTAERTLTIEGRIHQNLYLPVGGREVHAVLTLTSTSHGPTADASPPAAEVLVLDGSGSMDVGRKRERAIEAGAAAIEHIRDGVSFAVITGTHEAAMLWPPVPQLRVANADTRSEAIRALQHLPAKGGTAIGQWLRMARELLISHPHALRHVILLTDGRNEHETSEELDDAIRSCVGELRCDCRGVGVDFDPAELYNIAEKLNGTLGVIPDAADLPAHFAAVMSATMGKQVELELLLWTPAQATVRFLTQSAPSVADLVPQSSDTAGGIDRYLLGAWGVETRNYHVCIQVDPPSGVTARRPDSPAGAPAVLAEKLLGRVSLAVRDPRPADPELVQSFEQAALDGSTFARDRGQIRALWTDDPVAPLVPDGKVATVRGNLDLALDLRAGVVAWRSGDKLKAECLLRDVRARAADAGDVELRDRMDKIYDEESDTFRLDPRDEVEMFEVSTVTTLLDR